MHRLKKMFRIFLWTLGSVLFLFILCIFLLRLPAVQDYITQKAVGYVEGEIGTEVRLQRLYVGFPQSIVMEGLYFEDQQGDTLVDLGTMEVDMDMWALWHNRLVLNSISVDDLNSHIYTTGDSTFNYQYIINAFSSDERQQTERDSASGMDCTIENIHLTDITFVYEDAVGGMKLDARMGKMEASMDAFDPGEKRFHAGRIHLSDTDIAYVQSKELPSSESEGLPAVDIGAEAIILDSVRSHYRSVPNGQTIDLDLGHFAVYPTEVNLQNQRILLDRIELFDSDLAYVIDSRSSPDTVQEGKIGETLIPEPLASWTVEWREFETARNAFRYEDNTYAKKGAGLDYHHMHWQNIHFRLRDFKLSYPEFHVDILGMRGSEQSGLSLRELTTSVELHEDGMQIEHAHLKTSHTDLRFDARASFSDPMDLIERLEKVTVDFELSQSTVGFRDILVFNPQLKDQQPFAGNRQGKLQLRTRFDGRIGQLSIEELIAQYEGTTRLNARGSIEGLPNLDTTRFKLDIPHMASTKYQVQQFLPEGSLPENIRLPDHFTASAKCNGRIDDFDVQFELLSSMGQLRGTTSLAILNVDVPSYTADLRLDAFDLGAVLQDSTFGRMNAQMHLEGRHFDWQQMQAEFQTTVDEVVYRGYRYRDLSLEARVDSQRISTTGQLRDSNIVLDLQSELNLHEDLPIYNGRIDLRGTDFQSLGLTDENIRANGVFRIDGIGMDPDSLKGSASFSNILILKDGESYRMDSLFADVNTMDSISRLDLQSDFLYGYVEGNVDPVQFAGVFRRHIEQYLDTTSTDSLIAGEAVQQFDFEFTIDESAVLTEVFIPKLEKLAPGSISGYYNSKDRDMEMNIFFPEFIYDGTTVDSLNFYVTSARRSMDFSLLAETIMNPAFRVDNPRLSGSVQNRTLAISLDVAEDTAYQNILLSGRLNMEDSNYVFRFDREGVVLDNEPWQVPEDHSLRFGPEGFQVQNMKISQERRSVSFEPEGEDALRIAFEQFSLQDVSQAFKREQDPVTGLLNGHILIQSAQGGYLYDADLTIEDLQLMESPIGTLSMLVENPETNLFEFDARLSGNGNKANVRGRYDLRPDPAQMGFDLELAKLQMKSLQPFTGGQLKRMEGYITGNASIQGNRNSPDIQGRLQFNEAAMHVTTLNVSYRLTNEMIEFDSKQVRFDHFRIVDSLGQEAVVNGAIRLDPIGNPGLHLDAQTDQFLLFDKQKTQDALFYGSLLLDSDVRIRGDLNQPVINATAHVVKGSNVSMVIPADDPRLETTGGIDAFIDRDMNRHRIMRIKDDPDTIKSKIRGIELRANISANRQSEIRIFLDRSGGNYLQLRGDADLVFGIDPSGSIHLTGRYEIYQGEYQMLFREVVRRKFQLQEGSSIVWSGDPMGARVDLKAIHTKEAEPLGLVQDQLSGEDRESMSRFRQKLPFQIELNMEEELNSPYIDFDLSLPQQHKGALGGSVQARLTQLNQNESEVNKQVFSLLVLGRFVPEDPFAVKGGNGAESAARRSVSKLLNAQLDKLSDKYINAVDLELSLESYEDYSQGSARGRTELNVGFNKAFFNDRLRVRVGGNIDLEGDRRQGQRAGDLIGDVSVEYTLTENGDWRLRAYRKNEYESIIDGDIIKTGTSIIFSRDYNNLRELFNREQDKARQE